MTDFAAYKKAIETVQSQYDHMAYYSDEELAETPAERKARQEAERKEKALARRVASLPKGTCPKCMKHIGKGIAFHVKACKG